jgi:hypothetical protein
LDADAERKSLPFGWLVGDVVRFTGGPLFLAVVYEEGADLDCGGLVGLFFGCGVRLGVGDATHAPSETV